MNKVIKLFNASTELEPVQREFENTVAAHGLGIPVPASECIVKIDDRYGFIMEAVEGISFTEMLLQSEETFLPAIEAFTRMQFSMHQQASEAFIPQKERFRRLIGKADMPGSFRRAVLELLERQPDMSRVCHNDFHPDNIISCDDRNVVIDWCDAASGDPMSDVARTVMVFENDTLPPDMPEAKRSRIKTMRETIRDAYIKSYKEIADVRSLPIGEWKVIVAAARLPVSDKGEYEKNMRLLRHHMEKLHDQ